MASALNRSFVISLTLVATLAVTGSVLAHAPATSLAGRASLQVQRHGDHGRAVDGLPIVPGMERASVEQRQAMATSMQQQMSAATPEQFKAQTLAYMQKISLVDQQLAAKYAPMNARSDSKASAQYMAEDLVFDGRPGPKQANVPILEISPYYAPDFSTPPMVMSETLKAEYYQSLLSNAPDAKVVSIRPSHHFVMLDQPAKLEHVLDGLLAGIGAFR